MGVLVAYMCNSLMRQLRNTHKGITRWRVPLASSFITLPEFSYFSSAIYLFNQCCISHVCYPSNTYKITNVYFCSATKQN